MKILILAVLTALSLAGCAALNADLSASRCVAEHACGPDFK